ncbi:hypothetical protein PAI11_26100 [Patulibacter medicamentivorans]|uniref:Uncharacterized protein n=1 Tax=Patulibacter medicamentivorans TaxID=1097667 RepID=H0E708_9ACTN|nr:hypothetical protein PAI11_26100 [Patulibacter medicamentivorans]
MTDVGDPLDASLLGSRACGVWWSPGTETVAPGVVVERRVGRCYAAVLERQGDAVSLAALRALQLGGSNGVVPEARAAGDRLAATGVDEPSWWLGDARPRARRGARLCWEAGAHRFTSFLLETEHLGLVVTLGVAAQQDRSGVAGDVALFADLDWFGEALREAHDEGPRLERATVSSVCRQIRRTIERTDLLGTGDPPGQCDPERDYAALRGLAQRWTTGPA